MRMCLGTRERRPAAYALKPRAALTAAGSFNRLSLWEAASGGQTPEDAVDKVFRHLPRHTPDEGAELACKIRRIDEKARRRPEGLPKLPARLFHPPGP
jgi:hypothetical protein